MWTLFLVFLSASGEPIQFEPLTSFPEDDVQLGRQPLVARKSSNSYAKH